MTILPVTIAEEIFQEHKPFLWSLCYRLTGSTADADDLVQETFVRALEHPPMRTDAPWRPWLVRVAMNLGRDLLRRRKRRNYIGPWLPSPLETGSAVAVTPSTIAAESPHSYEPVDGQSSTEGRYDLLESVSFAFLLALEALSPQQRAVLLLRDVFDYSVQETAEALGISEANVKTSHHRARRTMQAYNRDRCVPTRALQERTRQALERFLTCLINQDVTAIAALLTADVQAVSDGGGEFLAALRPVVGRDKIVRLYMKTNARRGPSTSLAIRMINGLPALMIGFTNNAPREASRMVMGCDLTADGRIKTLYS